MLASQCLSTSVSIVGAANLILLTKQDQTCVVQCHIARSMDGAVHYLHRERMDLVALVYQFTKEQQHGTSAHRIQVQGAVSELEGFWDTLRVERALSNLPKASSKTKAIAWKRPRTALRRSRSSMAFPPP
jgi:hypothetical protein